jgi:hypothetical protein
MDIVNGEWTLLDKKNGVAVITYKENGEIAKITFDNINDTSTVEGDLFNILGYREDTEGNREKYKKYIEIIKDMGKEILKNIVE